MISVAAEKRHNGATVEIDKTLRNRMKLAAIRHETSLKEVVEKALRHWLKVQAKNY